MTRYKVVVFVELSDGLKSIAAWLCDTYDQARESAGLTCLHGYGDYGPGRAHDLPIMVNVTSIEEAAR